MKNKKSMKGEKIITPSGKVGVCLDDECVYIEMDPETRKTRIGIKDDCPDEKADKFRKILSGGVGDVEFIMPPPKGKKKTQDEDKDGDDSE